MRTYTKRILVLLISLYSTLSFAQNEFDFENIVIDKDEFSTFQILSSTPSTCSMSSPIITGTGTFTSDYSNVDANGWRHFCDCNGFLLLSLDESAAPTVVIPDVGGVEIKLGLSNATYYGGSTGFITNSNGAAIMNRRWEVFPTTQPAINEEVNVRFHFTQVEFMDINDELANIDGLWELSDPSQLEFFKVTNQSLGAFPIIPSIMTADVDIIVSNYNNPTTTTFHNGVHSNGFDHYAEYKVTSFSGGGGGASGGGGTQVLPVELSKFEIKNIKNDHALLAWTTETENDNEGFYIEKSTDGQDWLEIAFIEGNRNSVEQINYEFMDKNPFNGNNYYRLIQVDFSGIETKSDIKSVFFDTKKNIKVYPNPISKGNQIRTSFSAEENQMATISLININGSIINSFPFFINTGTNEVELNTTNLNTGIFMIEINFGNEILREKIMIK